MSTHFGSEKVGSAYFFTRASESPPLGPGGEAEIPDDRLAVQAEQVGGLEVAVGEPAFGQSSKCSG